MKVYYAHSNQITNSPDHRKELKYLREVAFKGADVIDPAYHLKQGQSMDYYINAAKECEAIVVTEFLGFIGRGTYSLLAKLLKDMPDEVFLMRPNGDDEKYKFEKIKEIKLNEPSDWAVRYGIIAKSSPIPMPVITG